MLGCPSCGGGLPAAVFHGPPAVAAAPGSAGRYGERARFSRGVSGMRQLWFRLRSTLALGRGRAGWVLAGLVISLIGCGGGSSDPVAEESPRAETAVADATSTESAPFVLGDLIEPYDPPSLEEIDAKADWQDRPVVDSLDKLIQRQAGESQPPTEQEALSLQNDSPTSNEKIAAGLGRFRIEKDGDYFDDEPGVDWEAEIIRHAYSDISSTNPILVNETTEFEVNGLTSVGLFGFDWDMLPFAAKESVVSWQTSADGFMDKVIMRDDLRWSDGTPITAHDVVFSYKLIMSKAVPVPAMRTGTNKIRWIEAYDDQTLVFFHKQALATNVWNLNFSIVPKHVYEGSVAEDPSLARSPYHVKYEDNPVVGGPYEIVRRNRGQEVILERREDYYLHEGKQVRDKPFFKTVRFKVIPDLSVALLAIKKGDLEEMQILDPTLWTTQTVGEDFYKNNTKVQAEQWLTWSFQYNLKDNPFFGDLRVRQAIGYAFDHEELLTRLRQGLDVPGVGTFHPMSPWCPPEPPEPLQQDLKRARKLLNEAGWTDTDGDGVLDKKGVPFEFTIVCRNQQWRADVCNLLAENLERLGVICNVRPLEATVLNSKLLKHQYQASFGGWGTGADPDTSQNIWGTDEGRNFGHYSNPEVDRLYEQAKTEFDFEERRKLYQKIHMLIWEDQPYTWLFHQNSFYAFSKKLRGYNFSPRGPYSYGPGFSSFYKPAP